MGTTKNIKAGSSNNTLRAIAYNSDGSVKTDTAFNTTGISIVVQKIGVADSSALTLSAKSGTTWAAGAFLNLGGGDVSVDVADAYFSGYTGEVRIYGTFTSGFIVGEWYSVVGYDPTVARVGASAAGDEMGLTDNAITAAKFAANAIAAAAIAASALNDKGNWSKAGDQMDLVNSPNATARSAFATTIEAAILNEGDATALLAAISAKVEQFLINDGDAVATLAAIATAVNAAVVAGQIGTDLTTTKASAATAATQSTSANTAAAAAKTAAESVDAKLTAPRLAKIDGAAQTGADGDTLETLSDQIDGVSGGGGGGGGTDWTADERTAIRAALGIPTSGSTLLDPSTGILDTIRDQVVANGAALAGAPVQPTGRVASGGAITAYIGDDFRVRSGTQLSIPVADPSGGLYTKLNAIGVENLVFGAARRNQAAGAISGSVASLATSGSGADQLLIITVEITNCGNGLQSADDYDYQIEQRQTQGSEVDSLVEIEGTLELKRKVV